MTAEKGGTGHDGGVETRDQGESRQAWRLIQISNNKSPQSTSLQDLDRTFVLLHAHLTHSDRHRPHLSSRPVIGRLAVWLRELFGSHHVDEQLTTARSDCVT